MINKIFLLLPIMALSAFTTAKSEKLIEVEKKCEYYKNTNNYYDSNLLEEYKKERSIHVVLDTTESSCNTSNCLNIASGKKWDFIEIELNGDPSQKDKFPKNGDSGLYKISKDFNMYYKFEKIQNDPKNLTMISLLCDKTANCVSCSTGPFCLVGDKIKNVDSKMTIYKKILADNDKKNSSILLNYVVTLNNKKILSYNRYIYSNYNPYTSYGKTICTNTNFIKPLLLDILGGYKYE